QTRNTGKLCGRNSHPGPREMFDNLGSRVCLAGVHTSAGNQYQRRRAIESLAQSNGSFGDVQKPSVADRHPDHFNLDCIAQAVMMPNAFADQPTEVQQMQSIAGLHALWNVAYKTFEGPSIAEHTCDDVSGI